MISIELRGGGLEKLICNFYEQIFGNISLSRLFKRFVVVFFAFFCFKFPISHTKKIFFFRFLPPLRRLNNNNAAFAERKSNQNLQPQIFLLNFYLYVLDSPKFLLYMKNLIK